MGSTLRSAPPADFPAHAEAVVRRLRSALAAVVSGIPGFSYRRPNDLAAELGLDPKLAWNVSRCLDTSDPFAAVRFLPGPTGIRALLRAAQRRAAPAAAIAETQAAFAAFQALVRTHAGSRKYFNMLAAGLASSDRLRADVEHRRLMFEGHVYVWGVRARTLFRANLARPSADGEHYDLVAVRGFIDFRRMRPNVAWRLGQSFSVDSTHRVHRDARRVPLDPTATGPVPLLTEFCSQPIPVFRPVLGVHGEMEFEFVEDSVGDTARITCVTGELLRAVEPRFRTDLYDDFCNAFSIRTPAEVLVFDLWLHRDLFADRGALLPELYSDLFGGGPQLRYEPTDRLPLHDPLVPLGKGLDVIHTADIPRYPEMLRRALTRVGWNADEFDVYRLRIQYPPLPTTVMLRRPLPARPA